MRSFISLCLFTYVLELLLSETSGIRWLAIASSAVVDINTIENCDILNGLAKKQKKICRHQVELMNFVQKGATLAIDECQNQFRTRRWNCSNIDEDSIFGSVLNQGTREAAFVHAISAAAVAFAVTSGCSSGQLLGHCGCDRTVRGTSPEGFQWAGCSDNIDYGSAFSKSFTNARERINSKGKKGDRALVNLHNNEAGRRVLRNNMEIQCKCHGVSGSCELKTCWKAMPMFKKVGEILKEKFDGATEVLQTRVSTRRVLRPRNDQYKHHTATDLVYTVASPDFCNTDPKTGSRGTQGRLCNKNSKAIDGCELLCCGRGFISTRKKVEERCNCKFIWCCEVKCQTCIRDVEEHFCR